MCGIAGIAGVADADAARDSVHRMVTTLARRGPDSEGVEMWDQAVLGHRRLAIFDLSEAGRQPMVLPDRSVGVVFNGAIYNHVALRGELESRGHVFRSRSDTEVLLHGYVEWGIHGLISKLRGMFAFGLWDNDGRKLYLVRDRLGVKPLMFAASNGTIAFASTARALRAAGYVSDLDEWAIMEFLRFGFVTDDRSIYRGAVKVPAGTVMEWSDGTLKQWEYWAPPRAASVTCSFDGAVEETERLLLDSVAVRLHADVPVAALLSGGIDSSLICWALKQLGADITAYTIGTPGDPWDESAAARGTAGKVGIRHRVLTMSDRDFPEAHELISAYAEPFACASALGMLRVSRELESSAKVLLTGDGGDDVFLGYPRHRHLWLAEKLSRTVSGTVKEGWLAARWLVPRIGPLRRAAAFCDYTADGLNAYVGDTANLWMSRTQQLLGERLLSASLDHRTTCWSSDAERERGMLAEYLDYERKTYFVGEYMTKVDGATMHYGLEARSPFLDHVLWEFASSLPFDLRLHHGRLKAILRELARRRIGPDVARRRKRGFGIPVQRWIAGRWRPQVEAALRESILKKEDWIRPDAAAAQLDAAAREGTASSELWNLFVLELWLQSERCMADMAVLA